MKKQNDVVQGVEIETVERDLDLARLTLFEAAFCMAVEYQKGNYSGPKKEELRKLEFPDLVFSLEKGLKKAVKGGAPVNADGTINMFEFTEWLAKVTKQAPNN